MLFWGIGSIQNTDFNTAEGKSTATVGSYDQWEVPVLNNTVSQIATITDEQSTVLDTILWNIDNHTGGFYFIDAPTGTWKTNILNLFLSLVR
jgi:hypothetical protein